MGILGGGGHRFAEFNRVFVYERQDGSTIPSAQKLTQNPYSQAFKQRMSVRDFDNSIGGRGGNPVILAQAAIVVKPTERTLDYPAPRKFFPFGGALRRSGHI
jgi:hypothetical protein